MLAPSIREQHHPTAIRRATPLPVAAAAAVGAGAVAEAAVGAVAAEGVGAEHMSDRVGIGWRPELAAGILSNLHRIDVLEVIAEDYIAEDYDGYYESAAQRRALKTLAAQVPVMLHGVSLGMASVSSVDRKRLDKMARLMDSIRPESWSEHLAFVRSGEIEIGHLTAPPRTSSTIEGTAANLETATAIIGLPPLVENIATLIDPPGSDRDEPEWLCETLAACDTGLLLDLHNLYANSINFSLDPLQFLSRLPAERIHAVHISGGAWITDGDPSHRRILDDHLHDPPDPVYELLTEVAARCPNPLTVILERDGSYPPMEQLLTQLDRARSALVKGRGTRKEVSTSQRTNMALPRATPSLQIEPSVGALDTRRGA